MDATIAKMSKPRLAADRRGRRHHSALTTYRQLGARGMRSAEAGNLTALLHGLPPVQSGWTIGEISRLLFLRYLAETHRIEG
jgi:hypothetical protein